MILDQPQRHGVGLRVPQALVLPPLRRGVVPHRVRKVVVPLHHQEVPLAAQTALLDLDHPTAAWRPVPLPEGVPLVICEGPEVPLLIDRRHQVASAPRLPIGVVVVDPDDRGSREPIRTWIAVLLGVVVEGRRKRLVLLLDLHFRRAGADGVDHHEGGPDLLHPARKLVGVVELETTLDHEPRVRSRVNAVVLAVLQELGRVLIVLNPEHRALHHW